MERGQNDCKSNSIWFREKKQNHIALSQQIAWYPQTDNYPLTFRAPQQALCGLACNSPNTSTEQKSVAMVAWMAFMKLRLLSIMQHWKTAFNSIIVLLFVAPGALLMHWQNAPFKLWQHHSCDGGREETDLAIGATSHAQYCKYIKLLDNGCL